MSAPIADDPARVIPDPAEIEVHSILGVGRVGGRPQPHLVIQLGRHRLRSRIARSGRLFGQNHFNLLQLADPSVTHQLGHPMVDGHRAIFGACLEDLVVLANRFDQDLPLVDGECGLLTLHVFARFDSQNAHQHMPMVGRRDHHGVDVRPGQNVAKVFGRRAVVVSVLLVNFFLGLGHVVAVDVANGQYLRVWLSQVHAQVPMNAVATRADEADRNLLAGSHGAVLA